MNSNEFRDVLIKELNDIKDVCVNALNLDLDTLDDSQLMCYVMLMRAIYEFVPKARH